MKKNIWKRTVSVLLTLACLLSALALTAGAEEKKEGTLEWTFEDGVLTIDGRGTPSPFTSQDEQPWAEVRNRVVRAEIDDCCGLVPENIAYWFSGMKNLASAVIPASVKVIGTRAFYNCSSLESVTLLGDDAPVIEEGAFRINRPKNGDAPYDPYLHITAASGDVLDALCGYDWAADSCRIDAVVSGALLIDAAADGGAEETPDGPRRDVRGEEGTRAAGTCASCGRTCPYTLGYDQWTDDVHCVRHWCSRCGQDQADGVLGEAHTFGTDGICDKCGFYSAAHDQGGSGSGGGECAHPSTTIEFHGCSWQEICQICGEVVSAGVSHDFSDGDWSYYSASQHRRTRTCARCGYTTLEYGEHLKTFSYTPVNGTKHEKAAYCELCGSAVGTAQRENHTFAYGDWTDYSEAQHRRTKSCSLCGYLEYETADHADPDDDGACDDCGRQLVARFSVTVPSSLAIAVSRDGSVASATNTSIVNHSDGAVRVTGISVTGENGWSVVQFGRSMASEKVDSRQIGLKLNNASTSGLSQNLSLVPSEWTIGEGGTLPLTCDAIVSATSSPLTNVRVMTVVFTLNWAA